MVKFNEVPKSVIEVLRKASAKIPQEKIEGFIRRCSKSIFEIVNDHPSAISYSALGAIVGKVLDRILEVNIPFYGTVRLTMGCGWIGLGLFGCYKGYQKDNEEKNFTDRVRKVVEQEYAKVIR